MNYANKLAKVLLVSILVLAILAPSIPFAEAQSFQTWEITVTTEGGSQQVGTLNVESNGEFTASGFSGSTSQGSYDIIVQGTMSGTSIYFYQTADYDNGQGFMYADAEGTLNAAFPSATSAEGIINGYLDDPFGYREFTMTFTARKTAGGGGGIFDLGGNLFSYSVAALAAVIVISSVIVVRRRTASKKARGQMQASMGPRPEPPVQWRVKRPMNPQYGPPSPPPTQYPQTGFQGSLTPSPITMDRGVPITGQGASVQPPWRPWLTAAWAPGEVTLSWSTPEFDRSRYALLGYDISQQTYGPQSTAAQSVFLNRLAPNANQAIIRFNQTYRWSMSGDIAGFRVDPVFGEVTPQGQILTQFRSGGMGIRIGEGFGTFGIGP